MSLPEKIDLKPQEWASDRPKPREPVFGSGLGPLLGQLVIAAGGLFLVGLVFAAIIYARGQTETLLFGEKKQTQPALKPGESTVIDGYTITRTDGIDKTSSGGQPSRANIEAEMTRRGLPISPTSLPAGNYAWTPERGVEILKSKPATVIQNGYTYNRQPDGSYK